MNDADIPIWMVHHPGEDREQKNSGAAEPRRDCRRDPGGLHPFSVRLVVGDAGGTLGGEGRFRAALAEVPGALAEQEGVDLGDSDVAGCGHG